MFVLLLGFLALGPQVVLSKLFRLSLTKVEQCGPFSINFKGDTNAKNSSSIPSSLLFLPPDSVPISIPVSSNALSTPGLNLNFVPFGANTTFIASLLDAEGDSIARVSDITRVLPSGTTSCLSSTPANATSSPFSLVGGTVTQCENFSVNYTTRQAPNVRVFVPNGVSYPLKRVTASNGTATFIMQGLRGVQILLMYDDGNGSRRTSPLLTIAGDSASSTKCFPNFGNFYGQMDGDEPANSNVGMSRSVIIGSSVGGGVIVCVGVIMTLYLLRERRRKRRAMATSSMYNPPRPTDAPDTPNQGQVMAEEKRRVSLPLPPLPTATTITYPEGYVQDPPYVSDTYSPTISDYSRTSIEWSNATPRSTVRKSSAPLSDIDIETMLDIAGDGSYRDSRLLLSPRSPPAAYLGYRQASDTSLAAPQPRPQPDVPKNSSFFGTSPSYADMHGIDADGGVVPFFESPRSLTSSVLRPSASFNARISYASSDSRQYVYARPLNGEVPTSALTDSYPDDVLSGHRNSIPFPNIRGYSRNSRDVDASDRV